MQKDASLALTVKSESRVELETPWGRANKYNASCGAMKLHVCMCNDERLLHIMQNPFIHIHTYMYIIHSIYSPSPCIKKDTSIVGLWWYSPICLFTLCSYTYLSFTAKEMLWWLQDSFCEGLLSVTRQYLNIIEMLSRI